MSISNVSSAGSQYQTNPYAQIRQDIQNIGKSLQSGDLSGAQQAFAQLQQSSPNNGQSQGTQSGTPVSQAIQNLGSALQSGDLSGAQQAFAQLQQGMQSAGKGHGGHHHHSKVSATTQDTTQSVPLQQATYTGQGAMQDRDSSGNSTSSSTTALSILL